MKRILVTRPRSQADSFIDGLKAAGFDPICFPVIEIRPIEDNVALDRALSKLNCYDWVVFTSANAVDVIFNVIATREFSPTTLAPGASAGEQSPDESLELLREAYTERNERARSDITPQIATIGPKTAQALQAHGVTPDFVPDEYVAESILPGLGDLRGKWVLLPRAEIARKALPEAITKAGGIAHEIAVYQTLPSKPDEDGLAALKSGVDWITFTSPSTVQNFVEIIRRQQLDPFNLVGNPKVACIGPITERAAKEGGFQVDLVAEKYTTEGLTAALLKA